MDEIAARAGVPKSTIYKRHADKPSLLRTVILDRLEYWSHVSDAAAPKASLGLETRLKDYATRVLNSEATYEMAALSRLVDADWPGAEDIAKLIHERGYERMIKFLEGEIEGQCNAEGMPASDARAVAEALMAQLAGWLHTSRSRDRDAASTQEFAHRCVDLLFHGRSAW